MNSIYEAKYLGNIKRMGHDLEQFELNVFGERVFAARPQFSDENVWETCENGFAVENGRKFELTKEIIACETCIDCADGEFCGDGGSNYEWGYA